MRGNLLLTLTEVGPDPALTTLTTFDEDGNVGSIEQSFGTESYVTTFTYDTGFRPIEVELPSGGTESFDYDAQGRLTSHTDAAGVTTTTTYGLYDQAIGTSVGGIPTEVLVQDSVTRHFDTQPRATSA